MKATFKLPPRNKLLLPGVVIVVLLGVWFISRSIAATAFVASEPELGALDSLVAPITDSSASGGKAVGFNGTPNSANEKFGLVVIPDTQVTSYKWPTDFNAEIQWIIDNKTNENIKYAIQVGDVQEWPATLKYFETARDGFTRLDNVVPYVVAIGNHDLDQWSYGDHAAIAKDRSSSIFNTYFPYSKFKQWPSFVDSFPANTNDNSYHKFSAGGTDWGIITLKYQPIASELAWAGTVIAANPTRRFIINTHDYMNGDASRTAAGQNIWDNLAKKYKNIQFVVAGHINPGARRVDAGVNGNKVYQLLSDYQDYNNEEPNSYIRLMSFDPVAGTVNVKTYSPAYKKFMTGDSNQFILTGIPFGAVQ